MQGKPVTDFTAASTGTTPFRLSSTRRPRLAPYFHPKRFPFELLAHADQALCGQFAVIKMKSQVTLRRY